MRRSNGSRAGPLSSGRRLRRCTALSLRRGGASRRRNEADVILEDALGDRGTRDANDLPAVKATLDDLFRRAAATRPDALALIEDRKSTRLNSSHPSISYAVFCLKKKKNQKPIR